MNKHFFIKVSGKYIRINCADVVFMEGRRNYIKIFTENSSYMVLITMKRMMQLLPVELFTRIHKSFIVSLDKIAAFDTNKVWLRNKELPIGEQFKGELEKALLIINESNNIPILDEFCHPAPVNEMKNQKNYLFEVV